MNKGKLQAKQDKLKPSPCLSPQSSLFNSRSSALNPRSPSLISRCLAPNQHHSFKSSLLRPEHSLEIATPNPQNTDNSAIRSSQQLFIDVSTELLCQGKNVRFQASGQSMYPAIKEGEIITVAPLMPLDITRGDIILYLAGRKVVAHRVVRVKREKNGSASYSSANSSTQATAPSLTCSSTHSKTLNHKLIFILRGDASLTCDDPVEAQQILGKVVSVEREGRSIDLHSRRATMLGIGHAWASRLKRKIIRIFPWAALAWHRFCTILRGLLLIKSSL